MRKAYADIPEGQIHYLTDGQGEALLLLHQTAGSSDEYTLLIPLLAKSFRVIAMDTMGFGMSDGPPQAFSISDYAQTVKEFLAALGIKKASVMGHHTGATVAVEVAAAYPGVVDKLIISGCPYYTPEEREQRLARIKQEALSEDGAHIMAVWNMLKNNFSPVAGPGIWHKALVPRIMSGSSGNAAYHAVFTYEMGERLRAVKSPTLLISGTKDVFYPKFEETKRQIPRCKGALIEGGDALVALVMPDKLAATMVDFLKNPGV